MRVLEWLGILPKDQRHAIRLAEPECWCIDPTSAAGRFCRALVTLSTPDSTLYLEGCTEDRVPAFLEPRQVANPTPVALGTILPKSDRYHIAATTGNLGGLADLIDAYHIEIPVIHILLYRDQQVILEWYDAFSDEPIYVSRIVNEAKVRDFATALACQYRWSAHAA